MVKPHKQNLHFTKDTVGSVFLREIYMFVCIFLSVIFIFLDITNSSAANSFKMSVRNSFSPIFFITTKVANNVDAFFLNFNTVSELNKKNKQLLKENSEMQTWINKALKYQAENESLKELLKFSYDLDYDLHSAKIIMDNYGSFHQQASINSPNLIKNQTVISDLGLVGRVINTSSETSEVLLITDMRSKVPAMIERTRDKIIVLGTGSIKNMQLEYLDENAELNIGDRVITSGDGSIYIPGLLIGTVSYIDEDKIEITPATKFNQLEFVSVLKEKRRIINE